MERPYQCHLFLVHGILLTRTHKSRVHHCFTEHRVPRYRGGHVILHRQHFMYSLVACPRRGATAFRTSIGSGRSSDQCGVVGIPPLRLFLLVLASRTKSHRGGNELELPHLRGDSPRKSRILLGKGTEGICWTCRTCEEIRVDTTIEQW